MVGLHAARERHEEAAGFGGEVTASAFPAVWVQLGLCAGLTGVKYCFFLGWFILVHIVRLVVCLSWVLYLLDFCIYDQARGFCCYVEYMLCQMLWISH